MNDELDNLLRSWRVPPTSEHFSERMAQLFARGAVTQVNAARRRLNAWPVAAFGICVATLLWLTTVPVVPPSQLQPRPATLLESRVELIAPATSLERTSIDGSRPRPIIEYVSSISLEGYVVIEAPRPIVERRSR